MEGTVHPSCVTGEVNSRTSYNCSWMNRPITETLLCLSVVLSLNAAWKDLQTLHQPGLVAGMSPHSPSTHTQLFNRVIQLASLFNPFSYAHISSSSTYPISFWNLLLKLLLPLKYLWFFSKLSLICAHGIDLPVCHTGESGGSQSVVSRGPKVQQQSLWASHAFNLFWCEAISVKKSSIQNVDSFYILAINGENSF